MKLRDYKHCAARHTGAAARLQDCQPGKNMWGWRAVGLCVPRVYSGRAGYAGGGVPLGAVPALSWCGEVSLGLTRAQGVTLAPLPAL